jgi:anti-anti-sigma factor
MSLDGTNSMHDFRIEESRIDGATILAPSGSVTFESCETLEFSLEQAALSPHPRVVLDCRLVKALDSEALQLLMAWQEKLQTTGGRLTLANLNDVCTDIMVVTRLVHVLNIVDDLKDAAKAG